MRWLWVALSTSAIALFGSGCGSAGGNVFPGGPGGPDGSTPFDATTPGNLLPDGSISGEGGGGPSCTPITCATKGANCGPIADGCGGLIPDCGTCAVGQSCGGGGTPNVCGGLPCVPRTCTDPSIASLCGPQPDGCGGLIAAPCVTCTGKETCGGGGTPSKCGGTAGCVPLTPSAACVTAGGTPIFCGDEADGCGGKITCGTCAPGETCGGAGVPYVCGSSSVITLPDGGTMPIDAGPPICIPIPQATACTKAGVALCGPVPDGCGGLWTCASCTTAGDTCGGAGTPSVCGHPPCVPVPITTACTGAGGAALCGTVSNGCGGTYACPTTCTGAATCGGNPATPGVCGTPPCTPLTTCPAGDNCGPASNGCGGTIASCGTCTPPAICGGGGTPSQCGGGTKCVPKTTCPAGQNCGVASDGCGGSVPCGTCTAPAVCGGGGTPNQCGLGCTPKTCATFGYNCGSSGDGCGGTLSCGTCTSPQFCGGGGTNLCGPTSIGGCDAGGTTTLSGHVYDPANNLPVYNALVYVPSGSVVTPPTGINTSAPVCGCAAPPAYASAFTGIDGSFTLTNVPSGAAVTVVVQLGKWQRVFTEAVTSCKANTIAAHLTLPSTHLQGNIPRFAIDTGNVDTMECVLLKMGIAQSEFVNPAIAGGVPTAVQRVHMYQGSIQAGGAVVNGTTPTEAALTETASVMDSYDVILFPCQGAEGKYNNANGFPNTLGNLVTYANDGGRFFATHFHYDLLDGNGTFSGSANWTLGNGSWGNLYSDPTYGAIIDQTFARGSTLASWLNQPIVFGGTLGQIPVGVIRNDFSSVNAPAQRWMYTADDTAAGGPGPNVPIHYTFDTPFNQSPTCGRVVYSDFHVESEQTNAGSQGQLFPAECPAGAMTPQEKLLEFMLFDLTSCVSPPTCTPKTCADQGIQCGPAGDGCGNLIPGGCGVCASPAICGGGGTPGVCGGGCKPIGCPAGQNCGIAPNGCGGSVACGTCTPPATCGGGGTANVCGAPTCTPLTACPAGFVCGSYPDGCGGSVNCGNCTTGSCVGGKCVTCKPLTACPSGVVCGDYPDGCGGAVVCGTCPITQACVAGVCTSGCTPIGCPPGVMCGPAGNGCGGTISSCGTCAPGTTCGGGGSPGVCGAGDANICVPQACPPSIKCGPTGNGCGGLVNCGDCTPPQTCGGGGAPGVCGSPSCTPATCASLGANCGQVSDGCGGLTANCGNCTGNATCGGGGTGNVCGVPPCTASTCASLGVNCGPVGDGCGGVLQCGTCTAPNTCGGGGVANICGGGPK